MLASIHFGYDASREGARRALADANLISAAPDLFELLEELGNNTSSYPSALEADHGFDLVEWADRARLAINKANGEV